MMLMAALGEGYIVWDRAARIRFRKPGYTTLYADFVIAPEEIIEIRARLARHPELDRSFKVELKDADRAVHAVVERTIYTADKNHYRQKGGGDKK